MTSCFIRLHVHVSYYGGNNISCWLNQQLEPNIFACPMYIFYIIHNVSEITLSYIIQFINIFVYFVYMEVRYKICPIFYHFRIWTLWESSRCLISSFFTSDQSLLGGKSPGIPWSERKTIRWGTLGLFLGRILHH